ncbi:hypothetical protein [Chromobacterium haemolyticum]|uniref:Uncharacterized protein n=1 Tax=Chromobacterium haemolyticum TaxID=394935 RepID=A0A1W0D5W1_9NEIS|nr:hypothetical protein [Chromobacterium haemolyticum]OQS42338.1 hypothetical protein B0T45_06000 [Chromobacterium haemolyticum]
MEKLKQLAKIFDNLGLAAIAAAATVLLRDMTGTDGKFHLKLPSGDAGELLIKAVMFYAGLQVISLWILHAADKRAQKR